MTTEIRYYHLERTALEQALPKLLSVCLDRSWRTVVMARSQERVAALSEHLWTYDDRGFLPHGDATDGHADQQPIWLTPEDENPCGASVLFLTDGAVSENLAAFDLVCRLFDGRDPDAVAEARTRWTAERDAGFRLTYWQQTQRGWEMKAQTGESQTHGSQTGET